MIWTITQPTKPGYYWAVENIDDVIIIKHIVECLGPNSILIIGNEDEFSADTFTHFMGPLEVPGVPLKAKVNIGSVELSNMDNLIVTKTNNAKNKNEEAMIKRKFDYNPKIATAIDKEGNRVSVKKNDKTGYWEYQHETNNNNETFQEVLKDNIKKKVESKNT